MLYCKLDELDKLRMSSISWKVSLMSLVSWTVSSMNCLSWNVSSMSWIS